jgi:hypothetical protein
MWRWVLGAVVFWALAIALHFLWNPGPPARISEPPRAPMPTSTGSLSDVAPLAASHLQLWLTADRGLDCEGGTVTRWADVSGNERHAVNGSHQGPACARNTHALAGVQLPYFSGPGREPPFIDGTLDVDLRFLEDTDFTIFVVERRWADGTRERGPNEELIGTDFRDGTSACPQSGYQINLGYAYYDGYPALNYESNCYRPWSGTRGPAPRTPDSPPGAAAIDMLRLAHEQATSPTVWQNGVKINVGGASGGLGSHFAGGSIGRAFETRTDNRFRGDIAEIVVFDAALTDTEARRMEAYFRQHWHL